MEASQSVTTLWGVGEQRQKQLEKLGIHTLEQLLSHYPRAYLDLTSTTEIAEALGGDSCAIDAEVYRKSGETRIKGGMKLYKAAAQDDSGVIDLVFFNAPYTYDKLREGERYLFYGKIESGVRRKEMHNPLVYPVDTSGFYPCYALTKGLSNQMLSSLVRKAISVAEQMPDSLPQTVREQEGLISHAQAVRWIHLPATAEELAQARRCLMFEELFLLAVGVAMLRVNIRHAVSVPMRPHDMQAFYRALPFSLTGAQQRAIRDLTQDMCGTVPANRLIQGDVGSGKTMVAAAGAYFAYLSGAQSAMMAPTELLARQHYEGLIPLLERLGMRVGLLTGSMTAAQKRKVYQALTAGEIDFCVGTHALLSAGVGFSRLGLVITDEQHRFGVEQRALLGKKGDCPHTLVMSATPIPRTLALMIHGELAVSVMNELPPGRQPVKTYKIASDKRERAFGFIRAHLEQGRQAYIVCPLVEAADGTPPGLKDAVAYLEEIEAAAFHGCSLGLLHGKMRPAEKERVMEAFCAGTIQLLVSTTVIEVGVDVPNAVIMMVENAERFGLSQLHQLRGRVGRGKEESHCILLSDSRNRETLERLRMLCGTNDGFQIAEYDLQTRGPGNFLGKQQHGLPELKIADLTTDTGLVMSAQAAAQKVLEEDPFLQGETTQTLRHQVRMLMETVGQRPN